MNEAEYHQLLELGWRQKLSAEDEARLQSYLAEHPEVQADAEADATLSQLLRQLPDPPVASNFTACVVQAVDSETLSPARPCLRDWFKGWKVHLAPRVAWVALMLALLFVAQQWYRSLAQHKMAQGLVVFSQAAALPGPKLMQDFDAIQGLGHLPPVVDEELWVALNQ